MSSNWGDPGGREVDAAILLAAGRGSRRMPYTQDVPKPLLSVRGRPVAFFAMDAILQARIPVVVVVTHYLEDQVVKALREAFSRRIRLEFCHQPALNGTAGAVAAAAGEIWRNVSQDGYVAVSAADYAYPSSYIEELCHFHRAHSDDISVSLRTASRSEKVKRSQIQWEESTGVVMKIVEKPTPSEVNDAPVASLLYIAPREIVAAAQGASPSRRGEMELAEVLNNMIASGFTARGLRQGNFEDL